MWQRGNVRAVDYIFSKDKEKKTINRMEQDFFYTIQNTIGSLES